MKKFKPPTVEEVIQYQKDNPELCYVDPVDFFKGYNDGGWIDTRGNPVRNWKLKFRTRNNFARERLYGRPRKCIKCPKAGVYANKDDSEQTYWLCEDHKPKYKPLGFPQPLKTVAEPQGLNEKRNAEKDKLGV